MEEQVKEILDNVASVLNFSEWKYSLEKFESIGQNYFGILVPLRLIGKINDEEVDTGIVLKLAPTDERFRVSGAVTLFFAREIFMYSTVLKQYAAQQATMSRQYVIPTCYYLSTQYCREAIALKDMTSDGYTPYTHTLFLDMDHIVISLQTLARFHAQSFILKTRNSTLYEEAKKICIPLTEKTNMRFIEVLNDRIDKVIVIFRESPYTGILENLKKNLVKYVEAAYVSVEQTCICHGDIWKENILFKYKEERPVSACLIDYQTARMCSPAFDVLFLITSSTDTALRREHFLNLLDMYCLEIDKVLKDAGLQSQHVNSKESFEKDLKTVAPACFILANCALWLASGLQQDGHVRSKILFKTEEEKQVGVDKFKTIIMSILSDYSSYGYFNLS